MEKNIHPVFNIKRLLIQRELSKDDTLKESNWERFLPTIPKVKAPKSDVKKKKPMKPKKEYTPFPPVPQQSKVDKELESGEYFVKNPGYYAKKKAEEKKKLANKPKSDPKSITKSKKPSGKDVPSNNSKGKVRGPRPKFGGKKG